MSQYPPPFQPPQGPLGYAPYNAGADLLAPARRAGVMLFVLGGVGLACGLCVSIGAWTASFDQLRAQLGGRLPQTSPGGPSLEQILRIAFTVMAALVLIVAILLVLLAPFVRRGKRGAIVTAIVICVLMVLWSLFNGLAGLLRIGMDPSAGTAGAVAFALVLGAAAVLTLVWLIQALRLPSQFGLQQQQYQAQYLQYMQQHMGSGQSGYGYGSPAPGPPPPPPPPPPQVPPA